MGNLSTNAIYVESDGRLTVHKIDVDDRYKPQGSQTLVRVIYSAINPADLRHFYMGMSGYVAGYEWVGGAIETGPTSPFKVGQHLFGMTLLGHKRPAPRGVHQDYLLAEPEWTFAVPAGLDLKDATSFPIATMTSIDALFNVLDFGLPAAGVIGASGHDEAILIWGGGSILGQSGIQLAKAAGFAPIITTASPRHHDTLKKLGATHCFDYRSPDVVEQVRSALSGMKLRVVYDCVAAGLGGLEGLTKEQEQQVRAQYHLSSPALARQCCDEGENLKLVAVLPVPAEKDPEWLFPMPYRVPDGVEIPQPKGLESFFEGMDHEWGNRMHKIVQWLLEDGAHRWVPPKLRIVKGAEAGIAAIHEVFAGKAGGAKVLIEHPM